jgi:hypothetical protein
MGPKLINAIKKIRPTRLIKDWRHRKGMEAARQRGTISGLVEHIGSGKVMTPQQAELLKRAGCNNKKDLRYIAESAFNRLDGQHTERKVWVYQLDSRAISLAKLAKNIKTLPQLVDFSEKLNEAKRRIER